MSSLVNDIAHNYKGDEFSDTVEDYDGLNFKQKSELLQDCLYTVCEKLSTADKITGGLNTNTEYLLSIVASYLIAIEDGTLPSDSLPPSTLFEESLFPQLEAQTGIVVEAIEEGEEIGRTQDTSDDEGLNPDTALPNRT